MAEPLVSVLIAARDAEPFIGSAIESALAEAHRPLEIVVVDDGSADDTAAVAAGFGDRVRVVRQPASGVAAARNRLVELARGDVLVFLDSDDLVAAGGLDARVSALGADPRAEAAFGVERRFIETDAAGRPVPWGEPRSAHLVGAMMIRREAMARVGPLAQDLRRSYGLDWLLRAREAGLRELFLERQVTWRRIHGGNFSLGERETVGEFAHVLKRSLDRRRTAAP